MTDPFRSSQQRFVSHLYPIKQDLEHETTSSSSPSLSPLSQRIISPTTGATLHNSYYNSAARSYSTEPDLLSRNSMNQGGVGGYQFRSTSNLNQQSSLLRPVTASSQIGSSDRRMSSVDSSQVNTFYTNKELVKQLRSNIELLFKGIK